MVNLVKRNVKGIPQAEGSEPVRIIAGRYRLGNQIGKGGSALVYLANDLKTNRKVALKLFFKVLERDPHFVARFRKEVRIASKLQHPNIVRTLDFGYDDGHYYLVMDYINNGNLKDLMARKGQMGLAEVVGLITQLCDALHYAHSQGFVHRDIKPHTVLLDSREQVKLGDFGMARAVANTGLTVTGPTLGTIGYLAPEQIQNGELTPATDIYALGVVMFEMVTGHLPFENTSALAVALAHVQQEPPLPRIHNPNVSPGVELIIRRCMAKDPKRRFSSVLELKDYLLTCQKEEQIYKAPIAPKKPLFLNDDANKGGIPSEAPGDIISLPDWVLNNGGEKQGERIQNLTPVRKPIVPSDATLANIKKEKENLAEENPPIGKQRESHTMTGSFRVRTPKERMLLSILAILLLAGMSFVAIAGFQLVNKARAADSTPTATTQGVSSPGATGGLKAGGKLAGNTTWALQNSPVTVTEDLIIGPGVTLSIEPGVTVKLARNASIRVEGGKIQANGNLMLPVLFTSAQAKPAAGDWGAVIISQGGTGVFTRAVMTYGGSPILNQVEPKHPALLVMDGRLEMTNSTISQSAGPGLVARGKSSGFATNSSLTSNTDFHVYVENNTVNISDSE